jgi:gluconolactonase
MRGEVVLAGVPFGEGPVWCPDGTLVITHISPGGLRRIWPQSGRSRIIASTPGGANSAQLASDGGFVVTQNGGIDFSPFESVLGLAKGELPPYVPAPPGLQRVLPSGELTYLADQGFEAPNDLVVARDGTIYFTDPPHLRGTPPAGGEGRGRVWALAPGDDPVLVAGGFAYCNGIALSPEGRLLVVEGLGLLWLEPDGRREWWVEKLPGGSAGDGFCFDREGRLYVAAPTDHCVRVLERDGRQLDVLELGAGAVPTNCCFGGADGRTLFTTELRPGRVLAFEGMPTAGLPLHPWPAPAGATGPT